MADKKQTKVTLSTDLLEAKIAEIRTIDEKLGALKGTASEWMKKGIEAARATDLGEFVGHQDFEITFVIGDGDTVGSHLDTVQAYLEDAQQFGNELATAWIRANRTDSDETTALRERRAALATEAESMRSVFAQLLGDAAVAEFEVPKAPSARSGSTGPRTKASGSMTFYRVVDGEKVYQSEQQDQLSSVAFYHFAKCGVAALREAIAKAYGKVDETANWEGVVTVGDKTATIGWEKVATETTNDSPDTAKEGDSK